MVAIGAMLSIDGFAHSGRTDSYGCHTNRKTGDYHCHNYKAPEPQYKTTTSKRSSACCKYCKKGKACGDSCISITKT